MGLFVFLLKAYLAVTVGVILLYTARHYVFTLNRAFARQRLYPQDLLDSDWPRVSVLIPMHNEEAVASTVLDAVLRADYPRDRLEIIPIDDGSTDRTPEILAGYQQRDPRVRPLRRADDAPRGKQHGLNDGLAVAQGEIVVVYDADYVPPRGQIRELVAAFLDPRVGAVMGRVVPVNADRNLLTRILDLERAGGYQVDQQARYNLGLVPQYGGTVGAFRADLVRALGGFDPQVLAEDTELTFRLVTRGWRVAYANHAECYEEAPERWRVRARQIRRWSRGHNQVLFRYALRVWRTPHLPTFWQRLDAFLLLGIYAQPFLMSLAILDSVALFFLGEMRLVVGVWILLALAAYNAIGNFAPYFEIGLAVFLDGGGRRLWLLPIFYFVFVFNLFHASLGFVDAVRDRWGRRTVTWHKTERYAAGAARLRSTTT
jgi:cellulose synthase/poly-beta-1,6-N-acetylglucosamine synthase-like glycosyltransferase